MNRSLFPVSESLLNPKFDGYKLHSLDADSVLRTHPLPQPGASQSTMDNRTTPLSFQEVQSRVRHNHLSPSCDGTGAVYVDKDDVVTFIELNPESPSSPPTFHRIYDIPKSISSNQSGSDTAPREYPVAISLDPLTWLVADGVGRVDVVAISSSGDAGKQGKLVASFELTGSAISEDSPLSENYTMPFHLHNAVYASEFSIIAIITHRVVIPRHDNPTSEPVAPKSRPQLKTVFDVLAVQLDIPSPSDMVDETTIRPLKVLERRRGDDVPLAVSVDPGRGMEAIFTLMGGSLYSLQGEQDPAEYVPTLDEMAPIPRAGEDLDLPSAAAGDSQGTSTPTLPPPYSWHQTSDSMTVVIPLPATTPASSIKVTIGPKDLTLYVHQPQLSALVDVLSPRYLRKEWWAEVDASGSMWTWDKEGDKRRSASAGGEATLAIGLLTLHLSKKHEDTRWSHIFQAVGTGSTDPADIEVHETIDPSELWLIRESLEKYTAALTTGEDASGLGLGRGMPSLSQGEFDEEVDDDAGPAMFFTWVRADGTDSLSSEQRRKLGVASAPLLSLPLPVSGHDSSITLSSLVLKMDIDGLLFEAPSIRFDPSSTDIRPWKHTATYPALSFVLASKRDTKFIFHLSSKVVLVFESGHGRGMGDTGGNVYLYRGAPEGSRLAQQAVLKVGGAGAGALLGVCGLKGADGKMRVICLCETQLTIMAGIEAS